MVWWKIAATLLKNEGKTLSVGDLASIAGGVGGDDLGSSSFEQAAKDVAVDKLSKNQTGVTGNQEGLGKLLGQLGGSKSSKTSADASAQQKPVKKAQKREQTTVRSQGGSTADEALSLVKQTEDIRATRLDSELKREKIREQQFRTESTLLDTDKKESEARERAYGLEAALQAQDLPPVEQDMNSGAATPSRPMTDKDAADVASPLLRGMEVEAPPSALERDPRRIEATISEAEKALAMATPEGAAEQSRLNASEDQAPLATAEGVSSLAQAMAEPHQLAKLQDQMGEVPASGQSKVDSIMRRFEARGINMSRDYVERQMKEGSIVSQAFNAMMEEPDVDMSASDQKLFKMRQEQRMTATMVRGQVLEQFKNMISEVEDHKTLAGTSGIQQQLGGIFNLLSFGQGFGTYLFGRGLDPGAKARTYATILNSLRPSMKMGYNVGNMGSFTESSWRQVMEEGGASQDSMSWLLSQTGSGPGIYPGGPQRPISAGERMSLRKTAVDSANIFKALDAEVEGTGNGFQNDETAQGRGFNAYVNYDTMLGRPGRSISDVVSIVQADMNLNMSANEFAKFGVEGLTMLEEDYTNATATMTDIMDRNGLGKKNYNPVTRDSLHRAKLASDRRDMYRRFYGNYRSRVRHALGLKGDKNFELPGTKTKSGKNLAEVLKKRGSDVTPIKRNSEGQTLYKVKGKKGLKILDQLSERHQGDIAIAQSSMPATYEKWLKGGRVQPHEVMPPGEAESNFKVPNLLKFAKQILTHESSDDPNMVAFPSWERVKAEFVSRYMNAQNFLSHRGKYAEIGGFGHVGEFMGNKAVIRNPQEALRKFNDVKSKFVPNAAFYKWMRDNKMPISPAFGPKNTIKVTMTIPRSKGRTVEVTRPLYGYEIDPVRNKKTPLTNYDKAHSLALFGGADGSKYAILNDRYAAQAKRRGDDLPAFKDTGDGKMTVRSSGAPKVFTTKDLREMAIQRWGPEIEASRVFDRGIRNGSQAYGLKSPSFKPMNDPIAPYVLRLKKELIASGRMIDPRSKRVRTMVESIKEKSRKQAAPQRARADRDKAYSRDRKQKQREYAAAAPDEVEMRRRIIKNTYPGIGEEAQKKKLNDWLRLSPVSGTAERGRALRKFGGTGVLSKEYVAKRERELKALKDREEARTAASIRLELNKKRLSTSRRKKLEKDLREANALQAPLSKRLRDALKRKKPKRKLKPMKRDTIGGRT